MSTNVIGAARLLLHVGNDANMCSIIMDQQAIIASLEARAKACGISISELCRKAGVHPTTFSRWKLSDKNPAPTGANLSSLNAVERAMAGVEARPTQTAA